MDEVSIDSCVFAFKRVTGRAMFQFWVSTSFRGHRRPWWRGCRCYVCCMCRHPVVLGGKFGMSMDCLFWLRNIVVRELMELNVAAMLAATPLARGWWHSEERYPPPKLSQRGDRAKEAEDSSYYISSDYRCFFIERILTASIAMYGKTRSRRPSLQLMTAACSSREIFVGCNGEGVRGCTDDSCQPPYRVALPVIVGL